MHTQESLILINNTNSTRYKNSKVSFYSVYGYPPYPGNSFEISDRPKTAITLTVQNNPSRKDWTYSWKSLPV